MKHVKSLIKISTSNNHLIKDKFVSKIWYLLSAERRTRTIYWAYPPLRRVKPVFSPFPSVFFLLFFDWVVLGKTCDRNALNAFLDVLCLILANTLTTCTMLLPPPPSPLHPERHPTTFPTYRAKFNHFSDVVRRLYKVLPLVCIPPYPFALVSYVPRLIYEELTLDGSFLRFWLDRFSVTRFISHGTYLVCVCVLV